MFVRLVVLSLGGSGRSRLSRFLWQSRHLFLQHEVTEEDAIEAMEAEMAQMASMAGQDLEAMRMQAKEAAEKEAEKAT
eukprot:937794-Amphidinium_carterae.2